jgi:uncharacterized membrane protein YdbT with pleckstrin-like domain
VDGITVYASWHWQGNGPLLHENLMSDETTIWEGSPSQVLNLPAFIFCGLLVGILLGAAVLVKNQFGPIVPIALASAAILPILYALWRFIKTNSRHYTVTTERVRIREGILSKTTNEVELYRVRDYVLVEPLSMRLFGLADIVLATDDQINPSVTFKAIPGAQALKDQIRQHVEVCRDKKRVRVTEWENPQH